MTSTSFGELFLGIGSELIAVAGESAIVGMGVATTCATFFGCTAINIIADQAINDLDCSSSTKSALKFSLGAVELCLGGAAYCVAVSVLAPATFGLAIAGGVAGGLMMAGMVIIAAEMTSKEGLDFIKNL
jgi:Asp/Glu/hydantoin racemase